MYLDSKGHTTELAKFDTPFCAHVPRRFVFVFDTHFFVCQKETEVCTLTCYLGRLKQTEVGCQLNRVKIHLYKGLRTKQERRIVFHILRHQG